MYTQCPHCQTVFRISTEQLRAAAGKAHCCRCDQVFNALENLRERSGTEPPEPDTSGLPEQHNLFGDTDAIAAQEVEATDSLSRLLDSLHTESPLKVEDDELEIPSILAGEPGLDADLEEAPDLDTLFSGIDGERADESDALPGFQPRIVRSEPQHQGEESLEMPEDEPGYSYTESISELAYEIASADTPDSEIDEDMDFSDPALSMEAASDGADAIDEDTEPSLLTDDGQDREEALGLWEAAPRDTGPADTSESVRPLPFDLPDDLPELEPTEAAHGPLEESLGIRPQRPRPVLLWSLLILLLLVTGVGQLLWFERERLMDYPQGHRLLAVACEIAGCRLPVIRAPERIRVISRSVTLHPSRQHALQLQLAFSNRAPADQPYPQILLSLFSDNEELVARRTFRPGEYLGLEQPPGGLLKSGQTVQVEIDLVDPGKDVTGFEFDFL